MPKHSWPRTAARLVGERNEWKARAEAAEAQLKTKAPEAQRVEVVKQLQFLADTLVTRWAQRSADDSARPVFQVDIPVCELGGSISAMRNAARLLSALPRAEDARLTDSDLVGSIRDLLTLTERNYGVELDARKHADIIAENRGATKVLRKLLEEHCVSEDTRPAADKGHIDPDCEVARGVGWMCTCETPEQKAEDAKYRAECEAERDASSVGERAPEGAEDAALREQLRDAQDDAQENWQSVKRLTAESATLREQLERAKRRKAALRDKVLDEVRDALTRCPIVVAWVEHRNGHTSRVLAMKREDASKALNELRAALASPAPQEK